MNVKPIIYKTPYFKSNIPSVKNFGIRKKYMVGSKHINQSLLEANIKDYIKGEGIYNKENYSTEQLYERVCAGYYHVDNNQLTPIYRYFSSKCNSVAEFGLACGCSTRGLLTGLPQTIIVADKRDDEMIKKTIEYLKIFCTRYKIKFEFYLGNDLNCDIKNVDLLHIDSLHITEHIEKQLDINYHKVNKYILLHDFLAGVNVAVKNFLSTQSKFRLLEEHHYNHGLGVLINREIE